MQMEAMFGRFYKKVWPLSHQKGMNFTEKTQGNYKKVWPQYRNRQESLAVIFE